MKKFNKVSLKSIKRVIAGSLAICLAFVSCPVQVYADIGVDVSSEGSTWDTQEDENNILSVSDNNLEEQTEMDAENKESDNPSNEGENGAAGIENTEAGETETPPSEEDANAENNEEEEDTEEIDLTEGETEDEEESEYPIPEGSVPFRYDKGSGMYTAHIEGHSGIRLTVSYAPGVFPDETVLAASEIADVEVIQEIENSLPNADADTFSFEVKLLSMFEEGWKECQPDVSVGYPLVSFEGKPILETIESEGQSIQIYHVADSVEHIIESDYSLTPQEMQVEFPGQKTEVAFQASHFSTYTLLLPKASLSSVDWEGYFPGSDSENGFQIDNKKTYSAAPKFKISGVTNPDLVITIPKGIALVDYPSSAEKIESLGGKLRNGSASIKNQVNAAGNTVLTYELETGTYELGFTITLRPTYVLKDGSRYDVTGEIKSGNIVEAAQMHSVTMKNSRMANFITMTCSTNTYSFVASASDYIVKTPSISFKKNYSNNEHYPYKAVTMIVPLPMGTVPGYSSGTNFIKLNDKEVRPFSNGSVTYYASWSAYDPSAGKSDPILVYQLTENHTLVSGTATTPRSIYEISMGGIQLSYAKAVIDGALGGGKSGTLEALNTGIGTVEVDTGKQTFSSTSKYKVSFSVTDYNVSSDFVLSSDFKNDRVTVNSASPRDVYNIESNANYVSRITNKTGVEINNIKVVYTIDEEFHADRVIAHTLSSVSSSEYPSKATVEYRTNKNSAVVTKVLTPTERQLILSGGEVITWMTVTYDRLGSRGLSEVLSIYLTNRDKRDNVPKPITGQIMSAKAAEALPDNKVDIAQQVKVNNTYTLKLYKLEEGIRLIGDVINTPINPPNSDYIYNIEDNGRYVSSLQNTTGVQLKNVKVKYEIAPEFYANKIEAFSLSNAAGSNYPGKAMVTYKTKKGIQKTAELTVGNSMLELDDKDDAIIEVNVIYDNVGSGAAKFGLLYIYLVNTDKRVESKPITGQILAADAAKAFPDGSTEVGEQPKFNRDIVLNVYDIASYFFVSGRLSNAPITVTNGTTTVYNIENNARYTSTIKNTVGIEIEDIEINYTIDAAFYANRIVARQLSDSVISKYPSRATIKYKINNEETLYDKVLTADDKELVLEDKSSAITWMQVTYDKVGSGSSYELLDIYLVNREVLSGERKPVSAQIASAHPAEKLPDGNTEIAEQDQVSNQYTLSSVTMANPTMGINTSVIEKEQSFMLSFYSSSNRNCAVDNPTFYLLMPLGYIYGGYTKPQGYDATYTVRYNPDDVIAVSQEQSSALGKDQQGVAYVPEGKYILYTIAYQGKSLPTSGQHQMHFTVGAGVDTSEFNSKLYLPALFLASHDNKGFAYSPAYKADDEVLKLLGLAEKEEVIVAASPPTVQVKKEMGISIQSFITSEQDNGGEGKNKDYAYRTKGTYEYYIYNGLGSVQPVEDVEVIIPLPRKGNSIVSGGVSYASGWDAVLNKAVLCKGDVFEDAEIFYSIDGGTVYVDSLENCEDVTHVKVCSASGKVLRSNDMGHISLSFEAMLGKDIVTETKAYMNDRTTYYLKDEPNSSTMDTRPCTLNATSIPISGYVYKDYDGDLIHEADGIPYQVTLFDGKYAGDESALTEKAKNPTVKETGAYENPSTVYTPGHYTLRVEKATEECFWWDDWNEPETDWRVDGNYAYYSFEISEDDGGGNQGFRIYVMKPRTLSLSGFENGAYLYDTDFGRYQLATSLNPELTEEEEDAGVKVELESLSSDIVDLDEDGNLIFKSEGDAAIRARAPQMPRLVQMLDAEWVEAKILVKARKSTNTITFYSEYGSVVSDEFQLEEKGRGEFAGTYSTGLEYNLPTPLGEDVNYFAGWYNNEEKNGSTVTAIASTDYGEKKYWAKWLPYEVMYETSEGEWKYSSFLEAIDDVFDGGQIKFLVDVTLASDINVDKSIILKTDGNSRTVQCGEFCFEIRDGGSLALADNNLMLMGNREDGLVLIQDKDSKVVISHGTIENQGSGYAVSGCGEVRLSGAPSLTGTADIYLFAQGLIAISGELTNETPYSVKVDEAYPGKEISTVSEQDYSNYFASADEEYCIGYSIEGTLILQKNLTVKPDSDQTKYYGDADPVLIYQLSESVKTEGQLGRDKGEDAGIYQYTLGTLTAGESYYLILDAPEDGFLVRPQIVNVKPVDVERRVGEKNPKFGLERVNIPDSQDGNVKETLVMRLFASNKMEQADYVISEEITGVPVFGCEADENSPEGQYPITILSMSGGSENYEIVYEGEQSIGTLTVLPHEMYRLSYEGGRKVKGKAPKAASYTQGTELKLVKNPFTKEGYKFGGWEYGGKLYQAKTVFTMPDFDVVFKAKWEKTEQKPLRTKVPSPQSVPMRSLDNVPKTGQNNNQGTQQLPQIVIWNHAESRKLCNKKEKKG